MKSESIMQTRPETICRSEYHSEHDEDLQDGMRRGLIVFLCLVLVLSIPLLATIWLATRIAPATLPESEQAEIYAQVVTKLIAEDDTYGGKLEPRVLYIYKRQGELSVALERALLDSLHTANRSISFVDGRKDLRYEKDSGAIVGGGVLIALDEIIRTESNKVETNGSIFVASEAAGETSYLFVKVNARWTLKASNRLWIS
jgi:hypothetical protein